MKVWAGGGETRVSRCVKLSNADDPVLCGVNRLRGLLAVIETEPWMPRPTTEELEAAGFRKAASFSPPTLAEMMAVVNRRGWPGMLKRMGHG